MEEKLKKAISEILDTLDVSSVEVALEHPAELSHGDYSTNVAMVSGGNPKEMAEKIVTELNKQGIDGVEKVEIAGPGFINFYLDRDFFTESMKDVDDDFGKNTTLKGQKTIIEYTDPNPFKTFHIGHLMSNAIGESLSRLIENSGAKVKRANYQGDVGVHVAKAVWGKMQKSEMDWGEAYTLGAQRYDENKDEIDTLNKTIYERSNDDVNTLYDRGRKKTLEGFETMYEKLGTKFDEYFFESESGKLGLKLVEERVGDVFEKSEGAIIFKGEDHGLHTRVFINSMGLPTYEAKELALAKIKHDRYKYDKSIVVTANEQNSHFDVGLKALEFVYPDLAKKTEHVSHGLLKLPTGKMSSRTGDVISAMTLIDSVKEKALEKMHERDEAVAEKIAIAAIKFSILKQSPGKDTIFDVEESVSFEGASGPYLQYTYVRTRSLLEKAKQEGIKPNTKVVPEESTTIEKLLYRFPEVAGRAAIEYAPQLVTHYLLELASSFNSYYAQEKIVDSNDQYSPYKLALTEAVGRTLRNGLYVLGIETPERM